MWKKDGPTVRNVGIDEGKGLAVLKRAILHDIEPVTVVQHRMLVGLRSCQDPATRGERFEWIVLTWMRGTPTPNQNTKNQKQKKRHTCRRARRQCLVFDQYQRFIV